jgi:N6-L-threonylcarbamoyladenine synthase
MKILGIESSCDETAASVVEDGRKLLSNVIVSQIDIHEQYGGVVPEVAARSHIEVINPVVGKALADAGCTWDDIDAIAVTYAPGLIGSLLVGTLAARTLAEIHGKPLYPIHHVEAHVYANFIVEKKSEADSAASGNLQPELVEASGPSPESGAKHPASGTNQPSDAPTVKTIASKDTLADLVLPSKQPQFPMLALIVSGNHSQLVLFHDHGNYELLGQTQDDAVGEAFDKVAKIIGLPYPGGPSIAKAALQGDPKKYALPKAKLQNPYDFSFSGLKTALLRAVQHETGNDYTFPSYQLAALLSDVQRNDFAASFQQIAVETLVDKAEKAFYAYSPASVVIAGGVAANQELRRQLQERLPINIEYAPMQLCTDNGAMVATLAYYYAQKMDPVSPFELEVVPSLSMTKTAWAK